MPNWTSNKLVVSGSVADVEDFLEKAEGLKGERNFTFTAFIPQPEDLYLGALGKEEKDKYGAHNWHDWNTANWGTKWDAGTALIERERLTALTQLAHASMSQEPRTTATISFDSAWSPPTPVIKAILKQHPELEIDYTYLNEGCEGGGVVTRDSEHYTTDEDGLRQLCIEIHGHDPWAECQECGNEVETPDPMAVCLSCSQN